MTIDPANYPLGIKGLMTDKEATSLSSGPTLNTA